MLFIIIIKLIKLLVGCLLGDWFVFMSVVVISNCCVYFVLWCLGCAAVLLILLLYCWFVW